MIALGWKCRGFGNPRTVRVLREFVQQWDPKIVFLMETKLKKKRMEKEKEKAGFNNGLVPVQVEVEVLHCYGKKI